MGRISTPTDPPTEFELDCGIPDLGGLEDAGKSFCELIEITGGTVRIRRIDPDRNFADSIYREKANKFYLPDVTMKALWDESPKEEMLRRIGAENPFDVVFTFSLHCLEIFPFKTLPAAGTIDPIRPTTDDMIIVPVHGDAAYAISKVWRSEQIGEYLIEDPNHPDSSVVLTHLALMVGATRV